MEPAVLILSVHSSPPSIPVCSQLNPVHTLKSYLFNIYFNSTFLSTLGSSKQSRFRFPYPNPSHSRLVSSWLHYVKSNCGDTPWELSALRMGNVTLQTLKSNGDVWKIPRNDKILDSCLTYQTRRLLFGDIPCLIRTAFVLLLYYLW
jgi:hypothetical protein